MKGCFDVDWHRTGDEWPCCELRAEHSAGPAALTVRLAGRGAIFMGYKTENSRVVTSFGMGPTRECIFLDYAFGAERLTLPLRASRPVFDPLKHRKEPHRASGTIWKQSLLRFRHCDTAVPIDQS